MKGRSSFAKATEDRGGEEEKRRLTNLVTGRYRFEIPSFAFV
jgi:hypothetical protein